MVQLSKEMQAILQNTEAAVKVHAVAMTDGYAFVEDLEGRRYVIFTRRGARHLRFKQTLKQPLPWWKRLFR